MMINQDKLTELENIYNSKEGVLLCVIDGAIGLGKTYTINRFLSDKGSVIHINFEEKTTYVFEPFVFAICSFTGCDADSLMISESSLKLKETLTKKLLDLCHKEHIIIFFENLVNCDKEQILFISKLLQTLDRSNLKPFVIAEIDSEAVSISGVEYPLDSLPCKSRFIRFGKLSDNESKKYIIYLLQNLTRISEESLNYIIEAGSGNFNNLNIIVNYLKRKGYIRFEGSQCICNEIPNGELLKALAYNITNRYKALNDELQTILQKAGIVGLKFDSNLINEIFDVISSEEQFDLIEENTSLIHNESNSSYCFENNDVHRLILKQIKPQDHQKWVHSVIGFYKEKLSACSSIDKSLVYSYKISAYIKNIAGTMSNQEFFSEYEFYMIKCIVISFNFSDYSQALKYISEIKDALPNAHASQYLIFSILFYEAKCRQAIGEYDNAIKCYNQCFQNNKKFFSEYEYLDTRLDLAYCYYMNGNLPDALKIALSVQTELNDDVSLLNCKMLSFLSSIYHLMGIDGYAEDYYLRSLTYLKKMHIEKEYYIQLKKSSMIMDIEVAKPLLEESLSFFEKNDMTRELAETLHTYYTNDLYMLIIDHFESGIQKSISLFNNYGSIMIHYPLNTYGVYLALVKNDLPAAMKQFEAAFSYDVESFSKITLLTNMASCKMLSGEISEAKQYIELADKLIFQKENQDIVLLKIYHYINWSIYYKTIGDYKKSKMMLKKCLSVQNIQDRHKYWLECQLEKIGRLMNANLTRHSVLPETLPLIKMLVEKDTFFATMRFYE